MTEPKKTNDEPVTIAVMSMFLSIIEDTIKDNHTCFEFEIKHQMKKLDTSLQQIKRALQKQNKLIKTQMESSK